MRHPINHASYRHITSNDMTVGDALAYTAVVLFVVVPVIHFFCEFLTRA